MYQQSISKQRKALFVAMFVLILALVTVGIAEIAFRFVKIPYRDVLHTSVEFQYDPLLGMKGIPGFTGDVGLYRSDVSINPQGFRDEDWEQKLARAEASGAKKILCIGDSTLYGYKIHQDERLTEALAERYRRHHQPVEVFNAGIPSYGTGQELRLLEQLLPKLKPDVVVLRFCDNDFGDSALPYDHRFPLRVYAPFYDLKGNLVLNKRVPRRFSLLVEGTPLERLHSRFAVDRLQCALDDLRFRRHLHLWDTPPGAEPVERTRAQKARIISHLDYLVRDPAMADIFQANKERNFSLWQRMHQLCKEGGARFVFLHEMKPPALRTPQQESIAAFLDGSRLDLVNTYSLVEPCRPWAEVRGDGHPNGVDNYVSALALFNHLESAQDTPTFSDAPWFDRVPMLFDFNHPHRSEFLFGEWGRLSGGGRQVGLRSHLLLRHDIRPDASEITVAGVAPPGDAAQQPMRVYLNGVEHQVAGLEPGQIFQQSFPFPPSDNPLAFITISTKSPYTVQRIGFKDACESPRKT